LSPFELRPAVREGLPLLIGMSGPTGAGKTYSSLRMAAGIVSVVAPGQRFAVIDTENGRALHYADDFDFDHMPFDPPFTPARYGEAIRTAVAADYPVVVVDSGSHEHAGEGGLLDMHEEKLQKLAGNDFRKRGALTMLAWTEPKQEHKAMVNHTLLRLKAHVILCFRAEQKVEMEKDEKTGKTEIRPKRSLTGSDDGWIPIAEKTLPYELTTSLLFTPDRPGVPTPIKLEEHHRLLVPLDQPINEETGAALAAWAQGMKTDADSLAGELLALADVIGGDKREVFTAAIQQNRRANGAGEKHAKWLKAQIERASEAAEAARAAAAEAQPSLSDPQEGVAA
jgi:hypothetical protein